MYTSNEARHRRNLDGNLAALDRHIAEQERRDSWDEAQMAVDDAILDREGKEPTEGQIEWLTEPEHFAELVAEIKAHREAGKRGPAIDWQEDDCFFEHVHGARVDYQ